MWLLTHKELVSAPPAYLLVPAVSGAELAATAANGNGRNGHKLQSVANGIAVSALAQPTANGNGRANAQPVMGLEKMAATVKEVRARPAILVDPPNLSI